MTSVGVLHPGDMGASLASVIDGPVYWLPDRRSKTTADRAAAAGLTGVTSLAELAERSDVIVSVCPPGAAIDVADAVAQTGFEGLYADMNAIAPATAREASLRLPRFVDGGIIGPPVRTRGTTRLYLAGDEASNVGVLWSDSPLDVRILDGPVGAASAVKVCFATWTKASAAMLLAIRALARAEGVENALAEEWATSMPELAERARLSAAGTAPKAWRFVGEMGEHAAAFEARGLPAGFGEAAAQVYERMSELKDTGEIGVDEVLDVILASSDDTES